MSEHPSGHQSGTNAGARAAIEVVTIVRGRQTHLRRLIEGLARSAVAPARLTVVRMEDEPASRPVLEDIGAGTQRPFPIQVLWCPPEGSTLPLARARNLGVAATDTDHLILLDVDCIPGRTLVGSYDAALAEHEAFILGTVRYLEPDAVEDGWTEDELHTRSAVHPARPTVAGPGPVDDHRLFWSLSFAVRRRTFEEVGGFDEQFEGYGGEDTDLGFAAHAAGAALRWEPRAVAYHQHHEVYDPPLQHLTDIVTNAHRFRAKWGIWPMEGWLRAFAERGFIAWSEHGDSLEIVRRPTSDDIAAARRAP